MNLVDKAIGLIAPNMALKRTQARKHLDIINQYFGGGYGYGQHGASTQKKSMSGWLTKAGSPLEDIERNIETLRQRSRDLYMGAPLAAGALKTMRTNIVGAGLKLNPQIDYEYLGMTQQEAEQWQQQVEREFNFWAGDVHCDAQRMNNFYELQQLAFLSWLMSGDCFSLLPMKRRANTIYDTRVYLIEADRVCTPSDKKAEEVEGKIVNGVEIGEYGEVVAYHIAQKHPGTVKVADQKWVRVRKFGRQTGRQNMIHLMESERPEQRRGVPVLAPVIESLKQLSRYSEAEIMAAVVSGMYTVFVKSEMPEERPFGEAVPEEQQVEPEDEGSYELGNGAIVGLAPGEEIQESNPSRPNSAFDDFVTSVCRQIGSALEVPFELLLKHFTSSYSASRAALLEAWKMFRMRRSWLANDFCQPIYKEWLAEAVARGRISAPGFFDDPMIKEAYCSAEWIGPSQGQVDPKKEVDAAAMRVKEGFSTRTKETTEITGGDFKKQHQQRVQEEELMQELGGDEGDAQS